MDLFRFLCQAQPVHQQVKMLTYEDGGFDSILDYLLFTDSRYSFTTVPIAPGVHTLTQSVTGAGFLIGVFALDESEDVIYIHQAGFRLRDNTVSSLYLLLHARA